MAFNYNYASHIPQPFRRYAQATATGPRVTSVSVPQGAGAAPSRPPSGSPTGPASPDVSYQDALYNQVAGTVQRDQADNTASLLQQGANLGYDYGINPNGSIDSNVDVTNPFSKAALLKQAYQTNTGRINSAAASSGQLYAGSTQASQDTAGFNNLQGQDQLYKGFGGEAAGLYQQYLQNQRAGTDTLLNAQADAIGRHENDPAYAPPKPAPPGVSSVFGKPKKKTGPRGQIHPAFTTYAAARR